MALPLSKYTMLLFVFPQKMALQHPGNRKIHFEGVCSPELDHAGVVYVLQPVWCLPAQISSLKDVVCIVGGAPAAPLVIYIRYVSK